MELLQWKDEHLYFKNFITVKDTLPLKIHAIFLPLFKVVLEIYFHEYF